MSLLLKINKINNHSTVLVAPLDWGLGHATRCIPIIKQLLAKNCKVLIAASGSCKTILQAEFSQLAFLPLTGYNISYSKHGEGFMWQMFVQLPKIYKAIQNENKWLQQQIVENKIDVVISDNRLGMYTKKCTCIYISHQLSIKLSNKFFEKIIQKIHYRYINRYNFCWVPDEVGENNFAGELSHPKIKPKTPIEYIGTLSRFIPKNLPIVFDLAIVLSGPEPQRTVLENALLKHFSKSPKKIIFVQGVTSNETLSTSNKNILINNFLSSKELNTVLLQSKTIICRSGYSSIMDLIAINKKAILIPTPGQTEQEYLAKYLSFKYGYETVTQNEINKLQA